MERKKLLILIVILGMGFVLRFIKLSQFPVSMRMDEVAIGYNAYSLLKTGKDEWGFNFPLIFRSIGDYKPPILVYLTVPTIAIFGLNEFAVRAPAALAGSLTVLAVFFLVRRLTNDNISLVTSLLLAVSPWHIKFSRSSYEAILALLFVILGVYFFLKGVSKLSGKVYFYLSFFFLALSMYTYHSERVFIPFLVFGLIILYRKELIKNKITFIKSALWGILILLPLIFLLFRPEGQLRAKNTFFIGDLELQKILYKSTDYEVNPYALMRSNTYVTLKFWLKRYLGYFDSDFIFIDAMNMTREGAADIGILYLVEPPFFILGAFLAAFTSYNLLGKIKKLVFLWLFLGPLAASLANNAYHPLRALTIIPIYQLFTAYGFVFFFSKIRNHLFKKIYLGLSLSFLFFNVLYFLELYFIHYPNAHSEYDMDGWKKAALFGLKEAQKYEQVVVDPTFGTQGPYTVGTPYLYFLFYGQIDPKEYLEDSRRKELPWSTNFRNFTFRAIDWRETPEKDTDKYKKNILFIGSEWVLPAHENQIIKRFYLYNGKEILRAVEVK